jgi:hypothetical protein
MRCFRFSAQEYRCFYGNSPTGVVAAAGVDEPEKQILDKYCFTAKRGFDEPRCRFQSATFVLEGRDVDHMETTYFYTTRHCERSEDSMVVMPAKCGPPPSADPATQS